MNTIRRYVWYVVVAALSVLVTLLFGHPGDHTEPQVEPATISNCKVAWMSLLEDSSEQQQQLVTKNCQLDDYWSKPEDLGDGSKVMHLQGYEDISLVFVHVADGRDIDANGTAVSISGLSHVQTVWLVNGDYTLVALPTQTPPPPTPIPQLPQPNTFNERNGLVEMYNSRYQSAECQLYRLLGGPAYSDPHIVPNIVGIDTTSDQSLYCYYPIILVRK